MLSLEEAALVAIAQGAESPSDVAKALRISYEDANRVLEKLVHRGLVRVEERGWWIFKRRVYVLTAEGYRLASEALEKLKSIAEAIKRDLESGKRESIDMLASQWGYVLPLLMWLHLIDIPLLTMLALDTAMHPIDVEDQEVDMGSDMDIDVDYV